MSSFFLEHVVGVIFFNFLWMSLLVDVVANVNLMLLGMFDVEDDDDDDDEDEDDDDDDNDDNGNDDADDADDENVDDNNGVDVDVVVYDVVADYVDDNDGHVSNFKANDVDGFAFQYCIFLHYIISDSNNFSHYIFFCS
jgi:hypothetical protein